MDKLTTASFAGLLLPLCFYVSPVIGPLPAVAALLPHDSHLHYCCQ